MREFSASSIHRLFAKAYIYLLCFRMISQLTFLNAFLSITVNWIDSIISFLGIVFLILSNQGKLVLPGDEEGKLFRIISSIILILNCSSLFMSIVLYSKVGSLAGETTFQTFAPTCIYFFQYIIMIYYNMCVFKILDIKEITRILDRVIGLEIVIGYYQILMISIQGPFITIQNALDIFKLFYSAETSAKIGRISLSAREPAGAASMITIMFIPYILANIIQGNNTNRNIIRFFLFLPILYYTKSSTGYILFFVLIASYILVLIKNGNSSKILKYCFGFVLIIASYLVLYETGIISLALRNDDLIYILIKKVQDRDNMSTINREVNLYMNWGAFSEYPLLGVGNGNQGFFFSKYVPNWAMTSTTIQKMVSNPTSVTDGATFFPGGLSGYGLLGLIIFLFYIRKSNYVLNHRREKKGYLYFWYKIAAPVIFVFGFSSGFAATFWLWFVISIPFLEICNESGNELIY